MIEDIRTSQDGMKYEVLGNIVAELRKRITFGIFGEERMQFLLAGIQNKVEYNLESSQKSAGILEACSDLKVRHSALNGSNFKYHFGRGRFHMLPQYYKTSHDYF